MNDSAVLHRYLDAWELSCPRTIAQTRTSQVYTVRYGAETVVLKLMSTSEAKERRGALSLRFFDGHAAVRLLRHDEDAHLVEYAPGEELALLVERGHDQEATRIIAQTIAELHSVPQDGPQDGLLPLERWFESLFSKAAADRQAGVASIYVRAAALAERLLADQRDIRVLHGDIHHYNIRQSPRGWLAYDPLGLVGERTYDCANALCNPGITELVHNEARLLRNAAILADQLDLDLWRVLAFTYAYACLNASQWLPHGGTDIIRWYLRVATLVEPHLKQSIASV